MSPRKFDIDPALLADLDSEAEFASKFSFKKMEKLAVPKGQSALIRLLPVQIGTNKSWLGRYAQHWVAGKRAIFCRKNSSPHLGGDPHYDCPNCRLAEVGLASSNKAVSKRAQDLAAGIHWYTVCLKFAETDAQNKPVSINPPACWQPYEFNFFRYVFDQLRTIAARHAYKNTQGIVDLEQGIDLWLVHGDRWLLQPADQHSVTEGEANPQEVINKIFASIVMPDIEMPDEETESEFFYKAQEFLKTGVTPTFEKGFGRRKKEDAAPAADNIDDDDSLGASQPPAAPAGRRQFSAPPQVPTDQEQDLPESEQRPEPAPAPRVQAPRVPAPQPTPAPVAPPVQAAPVQAAPEAPAPKLVRPQSKLVVPAAANKIMPAAAPQVSAAAAPQSVSNVVAGASPEDDDDNVTAEFIDPAPPVQPVDIEPDASPAEVPPPAVKATGTRLGKKLLESLETFRK